MRSNLMMTRRFAPLFWTQFLAAFNDNFLKTTLLFVILSRVEPQKAAALVTLTGAIFMAPFLLFSALGGQLADKYDKATVAERLKRFELLAAGVAVHGMIDGSVPVLLVSLFLFGVNSALFGPIKYGILPDLLERGVLLRANAWVEGATFLAILTGTIAAGAVAVDGISAMIFAPSLVALSLACWATSRFIPPAPARDPDLVLDWNIFRSTARQVLNLRPDRRIWRASLIVSWFWLIGAIILSVLPMLVKQHLGGSEGVITLYLTVFAVAVGLGSALAARASAGRISLAFAAPATLALALFCLDLAWCLTGLVPQTEALSLAEFASRSGVFRAAFDLCGLAIAGAFLVVPAFAALQVWSHETHRARVVGGTNIISAGFMTVGGGGVAALQASGLSLTVLLIGLAVANFAVALLMYRARSSGEK